MHARLTALVALTLLAGGVLRLVLALTRSDLAWPDEHFQTLEPAAWLALDRGYLSWEWTHGYRTWVMPGLYLPVFWLGDALGVADGLAFVHAARAFTALASIWALWRIDALLVRLALTPSARLVAIASLALSPAMIGWAPATLADTWAQIAWWGALPTVVHLATRAPHTLHHGVLLGLAAGLALAAKYQMAFASLGLFAALVWLRLPLRFLVGAALGHLAILGALGLLDLATWGAPFQSLIAHARDGARIAESFGTLPAWDYLPRLAAEFGLPWLVGLAALCGVALFARRPAGAASPPDRRGALAIIFLPMFSSLLALSAIGHKETRFALPLLPACHLALGLVVDRLALDRRLARLALGRRVARLVPAALALAAAYAALSSLGAPRALTPVDTSALERRIALDDGLAPDGTSCLLLVDHPWSFTRGHLLIGRRAELLETSLATLDADALGRCRYAITHARAAFGFMRHRDQGWRLLATAPGGQALFARGGPR